MRGHRAHAKQLFSFRQCRAGGRESKGRQGAALGRQCAVADCDVTARRRATEGVAAACGALARAADRTIKIWDLASGQLKLTLTGHIEQVRLALVLCRNGCWPVSAGAALLPCVQAPLHPVFHASTRRPFGAAAGATRCLTTGLARAAARSLSGARVVGVGGGVSECVAELWAWVAACVRTRAAGHGPGGERPAPLHVFVRAGQDGQVLGPGAEQGADLVGNSAVASLSNRAVLG